VIQYVLRTGHITEGAKKGSTHRILMGKYIGNEFLGRNLRIIDVTLK
jgi:hypothetical protein